MIYIPGFGDHDFFHESLGHTHSINRVAGLVSAENYQAFYFLFYGSIDNIFCTNYICAYGLHGKKFTGGNLFQSSSMKNIIDIDHSTIDTFIITNITNIEFNFGIIIFFAHIMLFFFITAEYTNFL